LSLTGTLARVERMQLVIANSGAAAGPLDKRLSDIRSELLAIDNRLNGDRAKQQLGEKFRPIINDRLSAVLRGVERSTYGPTATHRRSLEIAKKQIAELRLDLVEWQAKLSDLAVDLLATGAPWIEGEPLPEVGDR
jgi:hypothetical protein